MAVLDPFETVYLVSVRTPTFFISAGVMNYTVNAVIIQNMQNDFQFIENKHAKPTKKLFEMSVLSGPCFTPAVLRFNKSGRAEQSTMKIKPIVVDANGQQNCLFSSLVDVPRFELGASTMPR